MLPFTVISWVYRLFMTAGIILFIGGQFFIFGTLLALWGGVQFLRRMPIYKAIKHINFSPTLSRHRNRVDQDRRRAGDGIRYCS